MNDVHETKYFSFHCEFCESTFTKQRHLKSHISIIHENSSSHSMKCSNCDISFKTLQNYKNHLNVVHYKIKNYICDICDKSFANKEKLDAHMTLSHEEGSSASRNECNICDDVLKKVTNVLFVLRVSNMANL